MRAVVVGGSLGGLTAALVLRDQGWDVDVLERSPNPLEGRGTGIVLHPTTVRYLVERAGKPIGDIGLPAHRVQYLDENGSIAHEQPWGYRFASYVELYRGLLDAFGTERYHLSNELVHLDNQDDAATLSLTDGQTLCSRSRGMRRWHPLDRTPDHGSRRATPLRGIHCLARHRSTLTNSAAARRASCWTRTPTGSCRAATCSATRFLARAALCCSTGSGIRTSRRETVSRTCSPTVTVSGQS